jgi:hypothetical protein
MSIQAFTQLQEQAQAIGIYTARDLLAFYQREKRNGETLSDTVRRYSTALQKATQCAERLIIDCCENCVYNQICDTYADIIGD